MKLVYKKPFAEYFKEQVSRPDSRALIGKMQALEVQTNLDILA